MAVKLSLQKDPSHWPGGGVITTVLPGPLNSELEDQLHLYQNEEGSLAYAIRIIPVDRSEAIRLFREHSNASVILDRPLTNREKTKFRDDAVEREISVSTDGNGSRLQMIMHRKSEAHLDDFVAFLSHPRKQAGTL